MVSALTRSFLEEEHGSEPRIVLTESEERVKTSELVLDCCFSTVGKLFFL